MFVFHTPEQTGGLRGSHGNHLTGNDYSNDSELHPDHGAFLFLNLFAKFCHIPRLLVGNANPRTSIPEAGEGSGVEI